ncbi:MAG: hypothetical protein R2755_32775 [Acidimicrobiales bacterium]
MSNRPMRLAELRSESPSWSTSLSPVTGVSRVKSPSPMRCATARNASSGRTMRRTSSTPAMAAMARAPSATIPRRRMLARMRPAARGASCSARTTAAGRPSSASMGTAAMMSRSALMSATTSRSATRTASSPSAGPSPAISVPVAS